MTVRFYSSVAPEKTLVGTITAGQTTLDVSNTIGLPGFFPYTLAVDYESVSEELVNVTAAAGNTLTIDRGIDGTSATSHTSGARVRHVTSARDFSDSRNHENAANGVHGLDPSEDLVGTNKVQTLANKTFTLATGTFQNIDITNVSPHATTWTNSPAAGAGTIVWRMINGTDQHVEWKGNGLLNVRNNVAMDTNDTTRRIQITQSNGTTEKFYITASGTAVSLPRASSATTNHAFKSVDPNDAQTRPMFSVRNNADTVNRFAAWNDGHVSMAVSDANQIALDIGVVSPPTQPYVRVTDNTAAVVAQIDQNGKLSSQKTAEIRNTASAASAVFQVRGHTTQTADLQEWYNGAGTKVANIDKDGVFNSVAVTTTTGIITASTGWTVTDQVAVVRGGIATIRTILTRTGANITANSVGDIVTDPFYGTIAAAFRPNAAFASHLTPFHFTNDIGDGACVMNPSTGDIQLTSFCSNGTIATGTVVRILFTYAL